MGKAGTPEANRRFHQAVARWHAEQRGGAGAAARYVLRNGTYYRHPNGESTGEAETIERALAPLLELFGDEPTDSLTAKRLALVRRRMTDGDPTAEAPKRKGWCRNVANAAVRRIRTFARWCVAEGYAAPTLPMALAVLQPLKAGRCDARESPGKRPAPEADVDAALPFMPEPVQAIVQWQLLTACRPGEVLEMRAGDVTESGDVWVWKPRRHKNAARGHERVIVLGPHAQAIVRDRVKDRAPDAPVFSPDAAERLRWARRRQARKSKRWPSHVAYQQRQHEKRERGGRSPSPSFVPHRRGQDLRVF